ncbi:hypothetical protein [Nocardioides bruguierae]|uniref:Uncharacterized protein n=1 Tax=Nocardioides bruguierae TaxID=2945102 RepID=A0A9X2IGE3_9ACTN|nr:hypothetical protein [Nocardioides bruguierae]MCM0621938.1 hypothetical protein [Nocardioides bruguierae]
MWTSIRWFLAACLTAPLLALVLGVGVRIGEASLPTATGDQTASSIGMAVVGCVTMLVACVCPMALFRLLAFVDPGTATGASMRSSLAANGGVAGIFGSGRTTETAMVSAGQPAADGRTDAESGAEATTSGRFGAAGALLTPQPVGALLRGVSDTGRRGASLAVDVLGQSGIGHQGYFDTSPAPAPQQRPATRRPTGRSGQGVVDSGEVSEDVGEAAEAAEFLA